MWFPGRAVWPPLAALFPPLAIRELERHLEEETRGRAEERRRREVAEQLVCETTLSEYLHYGHSRVFKALQIADKSVTSTGFMTKVDGKYYPMWRRPWDDFTDYLQDNFNKIQEVYENRLLFPLETEVPALARQVGAHPAANEGDCYLFEHAAVETPLSVISARRLDVGPNVCNSAQLRFTTNNRELNNDAVGEEEEVDEEEEVPKRWQSRPRKGIPAEYEVKGTVPDGLGFRGQQGGTENLAFVFDYKAAHKLAVQNLQLALANDRLFMDVIQRVNGNRGDRGRTWRIRGSWYVDRG